jgi:signal transduction histidine kinase
MQLGSGVWGQERGRWLLLLLLLVGVLAPTGAVFWFMREAVHSQSDAARQRVAEAYRGQLLLLRERVDEGWRSRADALQKASGFPDALKLSGADSVILLGAKGVPRYPSLPALAGSDPTLDRPEWTAAREYEHAGHNWAGAAGVWERLAQTEKTQTLAAIARQAQIRCLMKAGEKAAALQVIEARFVNGPLATATDFSGRRLAIDEMLLALQMGKRGDGRLLAIAQRLAALLNDYQTPIPSSQRLFAMGELHSLAPDAAVFPTEGAERIAAQFLEAERARPGEAVLEASGMRGVWKLTAPDASAIALYRTATVADAVEGLLAAQGSAPGLKFQATPPGIPAAGDAIAAGSMLPGWQIEVSLANEHAMEDEARRRMTVYLWVGYLVIAAIAVTGVLIGQSVRREFRLARLKTDLVAAVSHELKTPLASIQVLVESLLEDPAASPQTTREYLELIAGENQRLARLIGNFLTFSRIERNRQKFDFTETKPTEVVQNALAAMRERLRAPECQVTVNVAADLPTLRADGDALVAVLINLLDNACKYTPGEKRIVLDVSHENGGVVFTVADNGIGIAPGEQKRIFRRFYQVDQRLARETGGCGLGLSIVEFIVNMHGGKVSVESAPGAGSRFRVELPTSPVSKKAAA